MFAYAILILLPALAFADDPKAKLESDLFTGLDQSHDGKITLSECESYFLTFDANKDGEISQAEFTTAVDKIDAAFTGNEVILYELFDRDVSGHVDKADIDAVFALADSNSDNIVDKSEFHAIFQAIYSG